MFPSELSRLAKKSPKRRAWPWSKLLFVLLCVSTLQGCASQRLRRDLRRKDLAAVQAASPKVRARLSPKWRRRYAKLLAERGQLLAARRWWVGSFLRGADLQALEELAVSYASTGEFGFAAALFAQVVATERGALKHRALACQAWKQRLQARVQAGAWVSAQRDERRLRAICDHFEAQARLAQGAGAQRMARSSQPALIQRFAPSMTPVFLNTQWQKARLGRVLAGTPQQGQAPGILWEKPEKIWPVAQSLLDSLVDPKGATRWGPWLASTAPARRSSAARELLSQIGQDPLLGPRAAGLSALLAAAGHHEALAIIQDNLRASASLQSAPSARLRVVLALVHGTREEAIFWMRLGASQARELGAWWLWCARWAQYQGQTDAAKVAHQALTKLVATQSPARWTLSWWRLKQKVFELSADPYLRSNAPSNVAQASLRAFWQQFLASLPGELGSGVWPALVDDLVLAQWSDAQIHRLGVILLGEKEQSSWSRALLVSRAKFHRVQADPEQALGLANPAFRGEAWRRMWSKAGLSAASMARYWELMARDPAWSPQVDPFAALRVLFSGGSQRGGQH